MGARRRQRRGGRRGGVRPVRAQATPAPAALARIAPARIAPAPAALAPVALALAALAIGISACGEHDAGGSEADRLRVVTTVSPITNIAANVAGGLAEVEGVVPEGQNSHEFEPAPSVARTLAEADVVFVNGLGLEEPTRKLAQANLKDGAEIVSLGDRTISPREYVFDFSFPRERGDPNPHLWTNPLHARDYARIVRDTLARRDPANADAYARNYRALSHQVGAFDEALREATRTVPPERRRLLTYHDSFPYFAREYGWEVIGAIQPSDFSEPTARDAARLIEQVRAERMPAVFGSEVFPSPVLEQMAKESGARYVDDLRDDDLPGEQGDARHSLLSLLRFDYATIVAALGGDPSPLESAEAGNPVGDDAAYAG
jgi:ABC-type Zn uptake system ZnuABC Zn-binding protein ZnuA